MKFSTIQICSVLAFTGFSAAQPLEVVRSVAQQVVGVLAVDSPQFCLFPGDPSDLPGQLACTSVSTPISYIL